MEKIVKQIRVDIEKKDYFSLIGWKKKKILADIHFSLPVGKMLLITASSGAGKSVLMRCINGQTRFQGKVRLENGAELAYCPQKCDLDVNETVADCLYYNARMAKVCSAAAARKKRDKVVRALRLGELADRKLEKISGGQLKRVQLASALVRDKNIFLLDEPDSGLDLATSRILIQEVRDIVRATDTSAIVISHYLTNIDLYDAILLLAKDEDGYARQAFYNPSWKFLEYFNTDDPTEIMMMVKPRSEGGEGRAHEFIVKAREERGRRNR